MQVLYENDNVDLTIIKERNDEIHNIENEINDLSEISKSLSFMLHIQGEHLDIACNKIENTSENIIISEYNLEKTFEYATQTSKTIKEAIIIISGISVGSLGFLGGPIIGAATLLSGATLSTGIVYINRFLFD
jgi:hypothetical protein